MTETQYSRADIMALAQRWMAGVWPNGSDTITVAQIVESDGIDGCVEFLIALSPPRIQRLFAADCAERACEQVGWTHPDSLEAIRVARLHAVGMATDEDLGAARRAADDVFETEMIAGRYGMISACGAASAATRRVASAAADRAAEYLTGIVSDAAAALPHYSEATVWRAITGSWRWQIDVLMRRLLGRV